MAIPENAALETVEPHPVPHTVVQKPTVATVRQIDVKFDEANPNNLLVFFSAAKYETDLATYPGGLPKLLKNLNAGLFQFGDDPKPKPPYHSPLSLKNDKWCYIIYLLSGKNWQFAFNRDPFSIGKQASDSKSYGHARRVDPTGAEIAPGDVIPGCKIAYIIADGHKNTGSGAGDPYYHPINLNIDLIYTDSSGKPAYMPLVVDPDVGYPGGSG